MQPGSHARGVHAERDGAEPLDRRLLRSPVVRRRHVRVDRSLRRGIEAVERLHDLTARKYLDPKPSAADLLDRLRQTLGHALQMVECRRPRRRHPPLDLRLGDHARRVGSHDRRRRERATRLREKSSPVAGHAGRRSTSAAAFSTTVPLKKSGFVSPQNRTALANVKSRKSFSSSRPCSTSSYASGTTSVMSGTSKCPMSELKNALRRAPMGLALRLNAQALIGSSASQPK